MDEIMLTYKKKSILYVSIVDWAFVSHRLSLAEEGIIRGYKVFLLTKDTGQFNFLREKGIICYNINFSRSGINLFKEINIIFKIIKFYIKIKPDLIHHIALKTTLYGSIASIFISPKIKIINAITGLGFLYTNQNNSFLKKIITIFFKILFNLKSTFFIFQNPDDLIFFQNLNILQNNYTIIKGAGVNHLLYNPKNNYINKDKIRIVLVARMLKDKGIIEFIQAAIILKNKYFNKAEFILVGGIDLNNPSALTFNELNDLCDNQYIKWIGHQNNIIEVYTNSDIVCLPSYREGIPKSLIEAMAIGCPIITTNAVGCKECVDDGLNGFLVPIKDSMMLAICIEKLINDENLRMKMGLNSRLKMEREMKLSDVIDDTFNFYNL